MSVPAQAAVDLPRPSDGLAGTDHDPDERGYFGTMGGRWLPEALVGALDEVADHYRKARRDPDFLARLDDLAANYAGRPSPLSDAPRLTAERISTTPAATRSTTCWGRRCWPSRWARPG